MRSVWTMCIAYQQLYLSCSPLPTIERGQADAKEHGIVADDLSHQEVAFRQKSFARKWAQTQEYGLNQRKLPR